MTRADCIYLSPHLDDAVLSCGGTIDHQVRAGRRVVVVTFFAATPENPAFTPHTRELLARWDRGDDPMTVRRAEDKAALGHLGAEAVHLPFLDAVYRVATDGSACYPEKDDIFGPIHPNEIDFPTSLLAGLRDAVPLCGDTRVYAPLGAGRHVDHLLVRRAAVTLLRGGCDVRFYEDFPYAGDQDAVRRGMAPWPRACWQPQPRPLDDAKLSRKAEAVAEYASQISTFWRDSVEMAAAVVAHSRRAAERHTGMTLAETFWTLDPACIDESEPS